MTDSGYILEDNFFKTFLLYDRQDEGVADILSGVNSYVSESGISGSGLQSGQLLAYKAGPLGKAYRTFIFLNGLKLINTIDYSYIPGSGGWYKLNDNTFSGVTGLVTVSEMTYEDQLSNNLVVASSEISYQNSVEDNVKDMSSLLFYNRLRQKLNVDYIETSSLDIVHGLTGFYETNLSSIINL